MNDKPIDATTARNSLVIVNRLNLWVVLEVD